MTAQDLLASAEASYDVALGRYKEGVGSILDLLAAQSVLEDGRVQLVRARSDWFLALVQFTHDTGTLAPPAVRPSPPAGESRERRSQAMTTSRFKLIGTIALAALIGRAACSPQGTKRPDRPCPGAP